MLGEPGWSGGASATGAAAIPLVDDSFDLFGDETLWDMLDAGLREPGECQPPPSVLGPPAAAPERSRVPEAAVAAQLQQAMVGMRSSSPWRCLMRCNFNCTR